MTDKVTNAEDLILDRTHVLVKRDEYERLNTQLIASISINEANAELHRKLFDDYLKLKDENASLKKDNAYLSERAKDCIGKCYETGNRFNKVYEENVRLKKLDENVKSLIDGVKSGRVFNIPTELLESLYR